MVGSCLDEHGALDYLDGGGSRDAVTAHIDGCDGCRQLVLALARVEGPASAAVEFAETIEPGRDELGKLPTMPVASSQTDTDPIHPDAIARFRIIGRLGAGAMGVVYHAEDPELHRPVAIKVVRGASAGAGKRMLREAQAMAQLEHPNVVRVYEVDTDANGDVFIAMEYVKGTTLRHWLQTPRPWRTIVDAYMQAGSGLAAAHALGIVHRDFKPDNVLIDASGNVKVGDFGLARAAQTGPESDEAVGSPLAVSMTQTGAMVGTPLYMSPEQLDGGPADARGDQFALCVALYEALFGERPFEGKNVFELRAATATGPRRPPSRAGGAVLWPVLRRGLTPSPADRFADIPALLTAIDRALHARRRRMRWAAGVAALGVTLVVGTLAGRSAAHRASDVCSGAEREVGRVWNAHRKQDIHRAFSATGAIYAEDTWRSVEATLDAYATRWTAVHVGACEATRVRGEQSEQILDLRMTCLERRLGELAAVTDTLGAADAPVVERAVQVAHALPSVDVCNDSDALLGKLPPPADPHVLDQLHAREAQLARAKVLTDAGKYDAALQLLITTAGPANAIGYPPIDAQATYELARLKQRMRESKASEPLLREAALLADRGRDDRLRALIYVELASVLRAQGRYDDGLEVLRQAEAVSVRSPSDEIVTWSLLSRQGELLQDLAKYPESERVLTRALALVERRGDRLAVASSLKEIGNLYAAWGKWDAALDHYQRSLAIEEQILGTQHPGIAQNLINMTAPLVEAGRFDEARAAAERALSIREAVFGKDHLNTSYVHIALGNLAAQQGKIDDAIVQFERVLQIQKAALGADHPEVANTMGNLGELYRARGRLDRALELRLAALAIVEKRKGHDHPELAVDLAGIARIYVEQQRPAEAIPLLERALELERRHADRGQAAVITASLAAALWDAGKDRRRARKLAREVRETYAELGGKYQPYIAQVDAWLHDHPEPKR